MQLQDEMRAGQDASLPKTRQNMIRTADAKLDSNPH